MDTTAILANWIYNLDDYCQIFDLNESDLNKKILDFPGNISSFNAQMYAQGKKVYSSHALYALPLAEVQRQTAIIYERNIEYLQQLQDKLSSTHDWQKSKRLFLQDFPQGQKQHRYQSMDLTSLPYANHEIDLALCLQESQSSNFIDELCRAAKEVRLFPLMNSDGKISDVLGKILMTLQQKNFGVEIRQVAIKHLFSGNAMLRIWSRECRL